MSMSDTHSDGGSVRSITPPPTPQSSKGGATVPPKSKKLRKYKHSVGGHHLMLSMGDGCILKECARREERFYAAVKNATEAVEEQLRLRRDNDEEQQLPSPGTTEADGDSMEVFHTVPTPLLVDHSLNVKNNTAEGVLYRLHPFIPRYHGARMMEESVLEEYLNKDDPLDGPLRMLRIQDVCHKLVHPCVMDLKMGARQYGLNAPDRKVESKTRKARESTSEKLGVRASGWMKWVDSLGQTVKGDKYECRGLDEVRFTETVRSFLNNDPKLMEQFRGKIQTMIDIFKKQNDFRFYTTSLLLIYDQDSPLTTCQAYMVDFAYTYPIEDVKAAQDIAAYSLRDEGYYQGLKTLRRVLTPTLPTPPTATNADLEQSGRRSFPFPSDPPPISPQSDVLPAVSDPLQRQTVLVGRTEVGPNGVGAAPSVGSAAEDDEEVDMSAMAQ